MSRLGIFGASGFAREVADIGAELGHEPVFIARDEAERAAWSFDAEIILERDISPAADMVFAMGIGDNAVRERVATRYAEQLSFPSLIHPSATFGRDQRARIEAARGVIVCAGVRLTNNIRVGDFAIFNLNATIGHDADIDPFVNIAPGVCVSGNVHIRTRCWIGTGAAINQGTPEAKLTIGSDTTIGSGAVVVKDCDEGAVYVGVPARRIQ
jgi:sugar O-acyltransferase (sialic acid O-acetyltransferase NeuD family)